MLFCLFKLTRCVLPIGFFVFLVACSGPEKAIEENLRQSVLFFSNFDKGVDALDSAGDPLANFDTANTQHITTGGVINGHLAFNSQASALNYKAVKNFPYHSDRPSSGAVAFWLNVNMADFEANYPEPFHIGTKEASGYPWDNAAIFIDIKKSENTLRFGCYPDKTQDITDQMVSERVISTPINWKPGEWHHVAITWSNFNSRKADAQWTLYIDGLELGRKGPLRQDMTWNINDLEFRFNHYKFPGKVDEIAVFNKMLTLEEVKYLVNPKQSLSLLFYKKIERR